MISAAGSRVYCATSSGCVGAASVALLNAECGGSTQGIARPLANRP